MSETLALSLALAITHAITLALSLALRLQHLTLIISRGQVVRKLLLRRMVRTVPASARTTCLWL